MSAADLILRREPAQLSVNTTWQWRREDLADYPATTYTLRYVFRGTAAGFTFDAAADGTSFAVTVAKSVTTGYTAGTYQWAARVVSGSTEIEVARGRLTVLPDLVTGNQVGHIAKVLASIEALIEARASRADSQYEIQSGGSSRRLSSFTHAELIALRETYLRYQKQQDAADLLASGRPAGRSIMTRFSRPGGYVNRPGIF